MLSGLGDQKSCFFFVVHFNDSNKSPDMIARINQYKKANRECECEKNENISKHSSQIHAQVSPRAFHCQKMPLNVLRHRSCFLSHAFFMQTRGKELLVSQTLQTAKTFVF